jgi:Reverse transcriptase (RNA-dependent DNA polymerase).
MAEINSQDLLRDEQFGLTCMTLQLAQLVERIKRNSDENQFSGTVFLDVAKAFDSMWIKGLLFKLTILEFPSYLVKVITSYLHSRTFVASFQAATSSCRLMQAGVVKGRE